MGFGCCLYWLFVTDLVGLFVTFELWVMYWYRVCGVFCILGYFLCSASVVLFSACCGCDCLRWDLECVDSYTFEAGDSMFD